MSLGRLARTSAHNEASLGCCRSCIHCDRAELKVGYIRSTILIKAAEEYVPCLDLSIRRIFHNHTAKCSTRHARSGRSISVCKKDTIGVMCVPFSRRGLSSATSQYKMFWAIGVSRLHVKAILTKSSMSFW
jgi:hypothetical protein